MRIGITGKLFVYTLLWLPCPVLAELNAGPASNCHDWVSAIHNAKRRPPLELLVDESVSGTRRPPDTARIRSIAEDAFRRNPDVQADYTNVDDYVRSVIRENTEEPLEYAAHYQYRILVSSNRFLVVSSNRMERSHHAYLVMTGTKHGPYYDVVTLDRVATETVRSASREKPDIYTAFLDYGSVSGRDRSMLEGAWRLVTGQEGEALWPQLCARGWPLELKSNGITLSVHEVTSESGNAVIIEDRVDAGGYGETLIIDNKDGRKLLMKEQRTIEGTRRIQCDKFVAVSGGDALYPLSILDEKLTSSGTPVSTRVLTILSVAASSEEFIDKEIGKILEGSTESVGSY